MNLKDLSLEELQKLRSESYKKAKEDGVFDAIYTVGKILGNDLHQTYGPKYSWQTDGVDIYIDNYGNYMIVSYNEKKVCSTHPCTKLFVDGEWVNIIMKYLPEAIAKQEREKKESEEYARQKLIQELSV